MNVRRGSTYIAYLPVWSITWATSSSSGIHSMSVIPRGFSSPTTRAAPGTRQLSLHLYISAERPSHYGHFCNSLCVFVLCAVLRPTKLMASPWRRLFLALATDPSRTEFFAFPHFWRVFYNTYLRMLGALSQCSAGGFEHMLWLSDGGSRARHAVPDRLRLL